jgi:hypothetical protein
MPEKSKMVIVSASIVDKIDQYRGELSRADFVAQCLDEFIDEVLAVKETRRPRKGEDLIERLKTARHEVEEFVTREEFAIFKERMTKIQEEFITLFIQYGPLLAGEPPSTQERERFNKDLKRLLQL